MDRKNVFTGYFRDIIPILKVAGMWIPNKDASLSVRSSYFVYNIFWFIYRYILYIPPEILILFTCDSLAESIRSSRDLGNHLCTLVKVLVWYKKRQELLSLMDELENSGFEYEECGDFDPNEIAQLHREHSWIYVKRLIVFMSAACIIMFTGLLLFLVFDYNLAYKPPHLPDVFPFPIRKEPRIHCVISVLWTSIPLVSYAIPIISLDSVFIKTISCISAHFTIIGEAFKTLRARSFKALQEKKPHLSEDVNHINNVMNIEMKKCICHLQFTYSIFDRLESIFCYQIASQMLVSWTQACFCLYLMSSNDVFAASGDFTYMCVVMLELFLYCKFGDEVTQASIQLRSSLYESDWINADKKFTTSAMITMIRLYKPVYIRVGKITPLTLQYFLTVVRAGYSLFTVLRRKSALAEGK